jgi:hypothetical protein
MDDHDITPELTMLTRLARERDRDDGVIAAKLSGTASRTWDPEGIVPDLRRLADGRIDLLAAQAGLVLGAHHPGWPDWPGHKRAAARCLAAGAEPVLARLWVRVGFQRSSRHGDVGDLWDARRWRLLGGVDGRG